MKFTLAVVALFSVLGRADAALRNSNAPVITSSSSHDTPKPAEDPHSFLSENGSCTTACAPKCVGHSACNGPSKVGVDQSKVGCGSCLGPLACYGFTGDSIGENSCIELDSCQDASATIGKNSCTKFYSCISASAIIGKNSCNAYEACREATGFIPDNHCNSYKECYRKHFPALSLYKDVVTGGCRSSLGKLYSDVRTALENLSKNSPEACAQFCRQPSLNNGFQVGMQFDSKICFCLYDDGGVELPSLVPYNTGKKVLTGYGPVAPSHSDGNPDMKCYPLKDEYVAPPSLNEPTLTIG